MWEAVGYIAWMVVGWLSVAAGFFAVLMAAAFVLAKCCLFMGDEDDASHN